MKSQTTVTIEPRCEACGAVEGLDVHHVKSRGAGGKDLTHNCINLCRGHHMLWHSLGWKRFLEKHPRVKWHLEKLGWEFEPRLWHKDN